MRAAFIREKGNIVGPRFLAAAGFRAGRSDFVCNTKSRPERRLQAGLPAPRCILEVREERTPIVRFCALASGSSGNAALVATERTRILVDAGLSVLQLRKRLAAIGEDLGRIDAVLITHEHSDHIAGLPVIA